MATTMVLTEDEALEMLAFLVTAARTQLDEAAEYGPLRLLMAAGRLADFMAERASPGHAANYESAYLAPENTERLLRERPAGWFSDYDALLLRCLKEALADGEKLQGSRVARWDYGRYNLLKVENPVIGKLPLLGGYYRLRDQMDRLWA